VTPPPFDPFLGSVQVALHHSRSGLSRRFIYAASLACVLCAADPGRSTKEELSFSKWSAAEFVQGLGRLAHARPVEDALADIRAGDLGFYCTGGRACSAPGLQDSPLPSGAFVRAAKPADCLTTHGDVEDAYREAVRQYATIYNRTKQQALGGGQSPSAATGWPDAHRAGQ
jgi:hypothetical protein